MTEFETPDSVRAYGNIAGLNLFASSKPSSNLGQLCKKAPYEQNV